MDDLNDVNTKTTSIYKNIRKDKKNTPKEELIFQKERLKK